MDSIFSANILEWTLLLAGILFLAYTAVVIKEEKASYLESAHPTKLKNFTFLIPSWWGVINQSDSHIAYERQDTYYEWRADFLWKDSLGEIPIEKQCVNKMKELQLEFDLDTSIIKNPSDFKNHPAIKSKNLEIVRIEGTATKGGTDRKYIDCFLIRDLQQKAHLWAISESSVLNGAVEGPYFEEVMLNFSVS